MKLLKNALLILLSVAPLSSFSEGTELQDLRKLDSSLETVESYLEKYDLPRMMVLKKAVKDTNEAISKYGLAHMSTLRTYQGLIVRFRYSTEYFKRIETPSTQKLIGEIQQLVDKISKDRGFDDSPYTQLTAEVFSQIKMILDQITSGTSSVEIKNISADLLVELGNTIAVAKQGDRPKAFNAGISLQKKIMAIMPVLDSESTKSSIFEACLNLRGLLEFYGEYAQIEENANETR